MIFIHAIQNRTAHVHLHVWIELLLHAKCSLQNAMLEKVVRNLRDEGVDGTHPINRLMKLSWTKLISRIVTCYKMM